MRNTQRKGDYAVAKAIASLTKLGFDVSIPLTESAAYDLIVEKDGILKRIQVRFSGSGEVDLRRIHSNSTGYIVKKTKINAYDWLYVLNSNEQEYLVKKCLHSRRSITPKATDLIDNFFGEVA
ncbi:MAG: group I intron-associated PD-(D/E)XK endonuclease [Candidatus Berkelbacteria bacterium]